MIEKSLEPMNSKRSATASPNFPASANLGNRMDLYTDMVQLNRLEQDWSYRFVKFLLNETEEAITFRADFMLDQTFQQYFFEQEEGLKQQGRAHFALGFPLVDAQREGQPFLTPLLIWELSLQPSPEKAQTWTIRQAGHQTCHFNRQLKPYLTPEAWEELWPLVQAMERQGQDSPDLLARFCNQLAERTDFSLQESAISLGSVPSEVFSQSSSDRLQIHWSGVFGIFPLENYWPLAMEQPPVDKLQTTSSENPDLIPLGPRVLDPWQAAAFEHALFHPETQILGKEGAGKTYLLMHLLACLLWQGRKVILVAPKLDDLSILQEALEELGLAAYSLTIANGQTILAELQERLKGLSQAGKPAKQSSNKPFSDSLTAWQKAKRDLDLSYKASRQTTFGTFNRIDTLAFMLRSGRTEGKELLASQLDPKDFAFSPREMERLSEAIDRSEPLFEEIRTLAHPLNNLNAGIFLHKDREEALTFIQHTTQQYLEKATQLQYAFIRELDQYSDQLLAWHDDAYQDLKQVLEGLQETMASYQQQFSRDTMESARATLKLYGSISSRFQRALAAQEDIQHLYDKFEEKSRRYSFFAHEFLEGRDRKLLQALETNLQHYRESLENWRIALPNSIQEEISRLNSKTVHPEVDNQDRVLNLEIQFDIFLDELNASGLYQLPIQSKTLTFPKRQRFLQECMEQLEKTRLNLRDFSVFYDWQKHWFFMPALARRIVTALVKVRPKSWLAAFESWYFEQCLTRNYSSQSSVSLAGLEQFARLDEEVRTGFLAEAQQFCAGQRQVGLKRLRQDAKLWKDWLKAKVPSYADLLACCDRDLEVLTDIFPIVCTTPVEASILFEQTQKQLDYLIYWGTGVEKAQFAQLFTDLARHRVLFSAMDQLDVGDKTKTFPLLSRYWQSPLDPDFTMKSKPIGVSFTSEFINGRFDEEGQKNEEEGQAILQALNGIGRDAEGHYPSVCIICFTRGQRNLMLTYLDQIRVQKLPGHEHIEQLEQSGLQVLHLRGISKKTFDIVLVSGTYGQTGVKEGFTEKIDDLKTLATFYQLEQLRSIPRKECRVFHSIPERVWKEEWRQEKTPSLALLALYLERIRQLAVGQNTPPLTSEGHSTKDTTFAQEIAWRIAPYISTDRLRLDQAWQSMTLPLILLPQTSSQATLLWLIDGFLAQHTATHYAWEWQQQAMLKEMGYSLRHLSTFEWWKYSEEQTQKLLADIRVNDQLEIHLEEE